MDWVNAMVEEVGREEMKEVSNRRKLEKYLVLADKVSNNLINEIDGEDVCEIVLTAVIKTEREKQEKVKAKLMRKVFTEWRRIAKNLLARKLQF